jgi:2-dehydropantoate 2-reductase
MRPTTVAVLGPGAVGGTLAARLLQADYRTICVAPPATVQLMALSGISFEANGDKPLVVRPQMTERLAQPVSLLLVTVKAPQLEEAIALVEPEAVADGVVLPLLNGLEHMEPLRERFGERVAAGSLSHFEAYRPGRMQIVQKTHTALVTMASETLSSSDLERAARILESAGIEVEFESDEKRVLWRKAVRLAVLAPATALTRRTVGELRTDPEWRPRMEKAVTEACAVAAADGVNLMPSSQWARIQQLDAGLTTSAARDVAAGRESEIDAITGAVVRAAQRLGVPCPELSRLAHQSYGL